MTSMTRWISADGQGKIVKADEVEKSEKKASEAPSSGSVDRQNNHLYFYSDVSDESVLKLAKGIREAETELRKQAVEFGLAEPLPIVLHVNSYGGSLLAGFAAMDVILGSKVPVDTVVEGVSASAATLISIVGRKRTIKPNSFMLVHQLSSFMWGKHAQMKD